MAREKSISRFFKFVLSISVLILLFSIPAFAGTVTIQSTGTPYADIESALAAATNGDVLLCEGLFSTHDINWPDPTLANNITLMASTDSSVCTLEASDVGRAIYVGYPNTNLTIEGFTIRHFSIADDGAGIQLNSTNINLSLVNCRMISNEALFTHVGGAIQAYDSSDNIYAFNCVFMTNAASNGAVASGGKWKAYSCDFLYNVADNIGGVGYGTTISWPMVVDCIFWGNKAKSSPVFGSYVPAASRFSDIQPNGWPGTGVTSCISVEPLIASTNEFNGDFLLLHAGSPCIDSGTMETGVPTIDAAGNARPHAERADMGLFESQGPSLKLTFPNGGEVILADSTVNITWTSTDEYGFLGGNDVTIIFSSDEGQTWAPLDTTPNTGSYAWHVPAYPSEKCRIWMEVSNSAGFTNTAASISDFSIYRPVIYVSNDGDDINGTGTLDLPLKTINKGLHSVTATGEVDLLPGLYTAEAGSYLAGSMIKWPNKANITMQISPDATGTVTIDARLLGRAITLEAAVSLTLEGITIKSGRATAEGGGAIYLMGASKLWLQNVIISSCTADARSGGAVYGGGGYSAFAYNCLFYNNYANNGGVAYGGTSSSWRAISCTFYNNRAVTNSVSNVASWGALVNSIIWGNSPAPFSAIPSNSVVRYSDLQTNGWPTNGTLTKNISVEPLFVSTLSTDPQFLRLGGGSRCIDYGSDEAAVPRYDLVNLTRPYGLAFDMGAYEYTGPSVRVIYPNGGEQFRPGDSVSIQFTMEAQSGPATINYSIDNGATWIFITDEATSSPYTWNTPITTSDKFLISIEVTDINGLTNYDVSDRTFANLLDTAYVSTTGDDAGPGTVDDPYKTIQKGLNSVYPTSEVYLFPGLYTVEASSYVAGSMIKWPNKTNILLAISPDATGPVTIDARLLGRAITLEAAVSLTLEGITIQNGRATAEGGGAIYLMGAAKLWLQNVMINSCTAESTRKGGAVYGGGAYSGYAYNCLFYNNAASDGGVAYGGPGTTWRAISCTFYNNRAGTYSVSSGASWGALVNSIIWGNVPAPFSTIPTYTYVRNCNLQTNGWPLNGTLTKNISVEPKFVSTLSTDPQFLRLGLASPCIDFGSSEALVPRYDLANFARPYGLDFDMGAYEFAGPSIRVIYPNGGELFNPKQAVNIQFTMEAQSGPATIYYSTDNGATWIFITDEAYSSPYAWNTPITTSDKFLISIEVTDINGLTNYDVSDRTFTNWLHVAYVSPTGDDSGAGSIDDPFRTIQKALDSVVSTSDVYLFPGLYTADASAYDGSGTNKSMISWPNKANLRMSISPDAVGIATVDAQLIGRLITVDAGVNLTIESVIFKNGHVTNASGGFMFMFSNTKVQMKNVIVTDCTAEGTNGNGGVFGPSSTATGIVVKALNSTFQRNTAVNGGVSYYCGLTLINSIFNDNRASTNGGVMYSGTCSASNCVFSADRANTTGGVSYLTTWSKVVDSIFYYNSAGTSYPVFYSTNPTTLRNNDIQPYTQPAWPLPSTYITGNISKEPQFVSTMEPYDFSLQGTSPCINKGTSEGWPTDITGYHRPVGYAYDIGAYEYKGLHVDVLYPNGGEKFSAGSSVIFTWNATDEVFGLITNPISKYYSYNNGLTWIKIGGSGYQNTGQYTWTPLPYYASNQYLLSVTAQNTNGDVYTDISDATFAVELSPVYVSPDGDDGNSGAIDSPFKTIQKGLDCVAPTGEVRLQPGLYTVESYSSDSMIRWPAKTNITLKLSPEATGVATIDARWLGRAITVETAVSLSIESVTIKNGRPLAANASGGGIALKIGSKLFLKNVAFEYCSAEGNGVGGNGGAIYAPSTTTYIYADNCIFFKNKAYYGGVAYSGNWYARNCDFIANKATNPSNYYSVSYSTTWSKMLSCIVWNNTGTTYLLATSPTTTMKYTDAQTGAYVKLTGNISIEPKFISTDETSADFLKLKSTSPCIDSGSKEALSTDYAGNIRPHGFRNDMGIYEFQGLSISVEAPNGKEKWAVGSFKNVQWLISGEVAGDVLVMLSTNDGTTWDIVITQEAAVAGLSTYSWLVPNLVSKKCRVSAEAATFGSGIVCFDTSDSTFEIIVSSDITPPIVTVESPNGGESYNCGQTIKISWEATDNVGFPPDAITLYYYDGSAWNLIISGLPNSGSYNWTIPSIPTSSNCLISVEAEDTSGNKGRDVSNGTFTVNRLGDVYVDDATGDDGNDGSLATPFKTIQVGFNNVGADSHVYVMPGTYIGDANGYDLIWPSIPGVTLALSPDAVGLVTIDANGDGQIISVPSAETLTIEGITIQNGATSVVNGAGLNLFAGSELWLKDVIFKNCTADSTSGGAINSASSTVHALNCDFMGNFAINGGVTAGGTWEATDCDFIDNYAYSNGGVTSGGIWRVTRCNFIGNRADDWGGVSNQCDTWDVTDSVFRNNSSKYGGVDMFCSGPYNAVNCTFEGNHAYTEGGVFGPTGSETNALNCYFTKNYCYGDPVNDVFGGVFAGSFSFPVTATNCVFADNWSKMGGVLGNINATSFVAVNCTFSGNTADATYGGVFDKVTNIISVNSIFWGNSVPMINISSIIDITYTDLQTDFFVPAAGNISVEPYFINPAGGNFLMLPSSECINSGTFEGAPTTDARGIDRPQPPLTLFYDMGAFEQTGPLPQFISTEVWVATDGDDINNNGTFFYPYQTISKGLSMCATAGKVHVKAGTYTGGNNRDVVWPSTDNITLIASPGATGLVTVDAEGLGRFASLESAVNLTIEGMNVQNGYTYDDTGSDASQNGAGIYLQPGSYLRLIDDLFTNCTAEGTANAGGVIYADGSTIDARDCGFTNNISSVGGVAESGDWSIARCYFINNKAGGVSGSGGVFNDGDGAHSINALNSIFQENNATDIGGVICGGLNFTAVNCTFEGNSADWRGGVSAGTVNFNVLNCSFIFNRANQMGAGSSGGVSDGGITGLTWTATNCVFAANIADSGAVAASLGSILTVNCTYSNNEASIDGALMIGSDSVKGINCIFWGNEGWASNALFAAIPDIDVKYSDIQANSFISDSGNISKPPYFIKTWDFLDPGGTSYLMLDTSECINAGTFEGAPPADIRGTPRPQPPVTIKYDMGAYEQGAGTQETVYISPEGSDADGDGSLDNPYRTLQWGLANVEPGGMIVAEQGRYIETGDHNVIWPAADYITLIASPNATAPVTFDALSTHGFISLESSVSLTIEGITLVNGYTAGYCAGVSLQPNSNLWLKNVSILHCTGEYAGAVYSPDTSTHIFADNSYFAGNYGWYYSYPAYGAGVGYKGNWRVNNCTFESNTLVSAYGNWTAVNSEFNYNIAGYGGVSYYSTFDAAGSVFNGNRASAGGVAVGGSWSLYDCIFKNNHADGDAGVFGGTYTITATNCVFYNNDCVWGGGVASYPIYWSDQNCTFYGNAANDGGVGVGANHWTSKNSVFWGQRDNDIWPSNLPATYHPVFFNMTPTVTYSDVQPDYSSYDPSTIRTDPLFVSTLEGAGYLRLAGGSLCIDSASIEAPTPDLTGVNARPYGLGNDMGVYEYQGPSIRIIHPNGGETWEAMHPNDIVIETSGQSSITYFTVRLSTNEGLTWDTLATNVPVPFGVSTIEYTPPWLLSTECLISVEARDGSNLLNYKISAAPFEILLPFVYVSPSGDDLANIGTKSSPFRTIQKGLNSVFPTGEVYAMPGLHDSTGTLRTYYASSGPNYCFILWPNKDGITLQATTDAFGTTGPVTLDAHYNDGAAAVTAIAILNSVSLTIEGIEIRNSDFYKGIYGYPGPYGLYGGGFFINYPSSLKLYNDRFTDLYAYQGGVLYDNSVRFEGIGTSEIRAENCVFSTYRAIQAGGVTFGGSWEADNCTFSSAYGLQGTIGRYCTWNSKNSIYWGGTNNHWMDTTGSQDYCDVIGGDWGGTNVNFTLSNCVAYDPKFPNFITEPFDLHLGAGSRLIDTASSNAPLYDIEGNIRPHGLGYDFGALEFQGPSISIESPITGQVIYGGNNLDVQWLISGEVSGMMNAWFSTNEGVSWDRLITSEPAEAGDHTYTWKIPYIVNSHCQISVEASGNGVWNYATSGIFEIGSSPYSGIYVSPEGNDADDGTVTNPIKTIKEALFRVSDGGKIFLMPGLYNYDDAGDGYNMIAWPNKQNVSIKLTTEADGTTGCATIDGGGAKRVIIINYGISITLEGITIQNGYASSIIGGGGAIYLGGLGSLRLTDVIIKYCTSETGAGAIYAASPGIYGGNTFVFADNSVFSHNNSTGGGGVFQSGAPAAYVTANNCVFNDNSAGSYGGVADSCGAEMHNCVFLNNKAASYGGVVNGSNWVISNSIFYANDSPAGKVFSYVSPQINYSDLQSDGWAIGYSGIMQDTATISLEPSFLSTDETDTAKFLRLSGGSPCIDTASIEAPPLDLANNPRPRGFSPDMGLYEFQGPSISVEAPNGGELLIVGSTFEVQWLISEEVNGYMNVWLSTNEGTSWDVLITSEPAVSGPSSYTWLVPNLESTECLISVEATGNGIWNVDTSNAIFAIKQLFLAQYVSPEGDDANDGSVLNPLRTIKKGLSRVAAGGTVYLMPGIFNEADDRNLRWPSRNNITMQLSPDAVGAATIDALSDGRIIRVESEVNLTIESITLQNGKVTDENGAGLMLTGLGGINLWLINVNIFNCTAESTGPETNAGAIFMDSLAHIYAQSCNISGNSARDGGAIAGDNFLQADNCIFNENTAISSSGFGGQNVSASNCAFARNSANNGGVSASGAWQVNNCIFKDNYASDGGGVVFTTYGGTWTATNCAFTGNHANNVSGIFWQCNFIAQNCLFYSNGTSGHSGLGSYGDLSLTNCIVSDNYDAYAYPLFQNGTLTARYTDLQPEIWTAGQGNTSADAHFVDKLGGNLRLAGGSPCIDAGTLEGIASPELDGNPRVHGFTVDMGPYEFLGPSILVESPDGGELLIPSSYWMVRWLISGEVSGYMNVWLSTNEGASWDVLITSEPAVSGESTYYWLVPNLPSTECLISVEATGNGIWNYDTSNAKFEMGVRRRVHNVTKGENYITIAEALASADADNLITCDAGVFNEHDLSWPNKTNITLRGDPLGLTTIDAMQMGRIFTVNDPVNITLESMMIQNCWRSLPWPSNTNGAAIYLEAGVNLWLNSVLVQNCSSEGSIGTVQGLGGAIFSSDNTDNIYALNSTFRNNFARAAGGVVNGGNLFFKGCTVEGNNGSGGGGVVIQGYSGAAGTFSAEDSLFINNHAISGGVLYSGNGTSSNCAFVNNTAFDGYGDGNGGVACGFSGNSWDTYNCTYSGNTAEYGGVFGSSRTVTATNCAFQDNSSAYGGVIYQGSLTSFNSSYTGNMGKYLAYMGAVGFGGVATDAQLTMINCTFILNTAEADGGILHTTGSSSFYGINSIFWGNNSANSGTHLFSGSISKTMTYSDIQNDAWQSFMGGPGTNNISAEPNFIVGSYKLAGPSPCIDKGTSATLYSPDRDGTQRPNGFGNDMGAYEFPGPSVSVEYPNGGENIPAGTTMEVRWLISGEVTGNMNVWFTYNHGATWDLLTSEPAVSGESTYIYDVPHSLASSQCLISVEAENPSAIQFDTSNATFEINLPLIVYVSPSGSDTAPGDGTIDHPYQTVQHGLNMTGIGGFTRLMEGTYQAYPYDNINNSFINWPPRQGITLQISPDAAYATIDAVGKPFIRRAIRSDYGVNLTIEGIAIKNGYLTGDYGAGIYVPSGGILTLNNVLIGSCSIEYGGFGGAVLSNTQVNANNSIFKGNRAYDGGVTAFCPWNAVNCLFLDNYADDSGGVAYQPGTGFVSTNCDFYNNTAVNYGAVCYWPSWTSTNSIYWGNKQLTPIGSGTLFFNASTNLTNCILQADGWNDPYGMTTTNTTSEDPQFASTDEMDTLNFLRLVGGSPCIDTGILTGIASPDLAGNPRIHGFNVDLGVYEFMGPSVSVEFPNGGESFHAGDVASIEWTVSDEGHTNTVNLWYSSDNGSTWNEIAMGQPDSGSYSWDLASLTPSTEYLISIEAVDDALFYNFDTSDNVFTVLAALAPYIYVSPEGNNGNDGSIDHPVKTFSRGLQLVAPHGYVYAMPGTYNPDGTEMAAQDNNMIIWPNKDWITLMGTNDAAGNPGPAIVDAQWAGRLVSLEAPVNLTIEAIALVYGYSQPTSYQPGGAFILPAGTNIWLNRVLIDNCYDNGTGGGAFYCTDNTTNVFANRSMFTNNYSYSNGGLTFYGNWKAINCVFENNYAPWGGIAEGYNGSTGPNTCDWEDINCVFVDNTANWDFDPFLGYYAPQGAIMDSYSSWTSTNSVYWGNYAKESVGYLQWARHDNILSAYYNSAAFNNCDIQHNDIDLASTGSGNISAPPMIRSLSLTDPEYMQISPSSSLINAGADESSAGVNIDLFGNPRPFGSAFDIGVHEYQGAPAPAPLVVYASPEGDDANDGATMDHPVRTIGVALQIVGAGGQVLAMPGDYTLSDPEWADRGYNMITWPNKDNITLMGTVDSMGNPGVAQIDGNFWTGRLITLEAPVNLTIEGIALQYGWGSPTGYEPGGGMLLPPGTNLWLYRVLFYNCYSSTSDPAEGGGAIFCADDTVNVYADRSIFYRNGCDNGGSGAVTKNGNWKAVNCVFDSNRCDSGWGGVADGYTLGGNSGSWEDINCVFFQNQIDYGGSLGEPGGAVMNGFHAWKSTNSIYYANQSDYMDNILSRYFDVATFEYCDIQANEKLLTMEASGAGNFSSDPLFLDTSYGYPDYMKLQPTSPCINTGTDESAAGVTIDLYDNPRPYPPLGRYDIGVYEYQSLPPVIVTAVYVSPEGNDAGAGTVTDPFRTFQWAVDHVSAGGKVYVIPGVYTAEAGNYDVTWPSASDISLLLTTEADGTTGLATVDLQSAGRFINVSTAVNLTIEGITIQNGKLTNNNGAGLYVISGTNLWLNNVNILTCTAEASGGESAGGAIYSDVTANISANNCNFIGNSAKYSGAIGGASNFNAYNCIFKDNSSNNTGGVGSVATMSASNCSFVENRSDGSGGVSENGSWYVNNCVIKGNYATNSGGVAYTPWGGTWTATNSAFIGNNVGGTGGVTFQTDLIAQNCIFYLNYSPASTNGGLANYSNWTLTNCIIWDNPRPVPNFLFANGTETANYCDLQSDSGIIGGTGNISLDPVFVDEPGGNLRLAGGSPCIDTGTPEGLSSPDLDSNPRVHGFNVDMGPYEFQGPSVRIIHPNGGEVASILTTYNITYEVSDEPFSNITILLSTNEGDTWDTVITSETGPYPAGITTYVWQPLSDFISTECRISIEVRGDTSGLLNHHMSDNKFTISIGDTNPPIVNLIQPDGGQLLKGGNTYEVTWTATDDITPSQNLSIEVYYSMNGAGGPWIGIGATNESSSGIGTFEWTLPLVNSTTVRVLVIARDALLNEGSDESTSNFTIDSIGPVVTILRPRNPGFGALNRQLTVKWTAADALTTVDYNSINIYYSLDNGSSWTTVITGAPNTGRFLWAVPNVLTDEALISIEASDSLGWVGAGLNHFSIITDESAPTVTVESPNGGEHWNIGGTYLISWESDDNVEVVTHYIYLNTNGGSGGWIFVAGPLTGEVQSYSWKIPLTVPMSTHCIISVEAFDISGNKGGDVSNSLFTISATDTTAPNPVTIESPIGGNVWQGGSVHDLSWKGYDIDNPLDTLSARLYYSTDNGATWTYITESAEDATGYGAFPWMVPSGINSNTCKIRFEVHDPMNNTSTNDSSTFTIKGTTAATVTYTAAFSSNNEYNYISVPFMGVIADTQQLAESIGASWDAASTGAPLAYGDGIMFEVFDNASKSISKTAMFAWDGGSWITVNGPSDVFELASGEVLIAHVQPGVYLSSPATRNVSFAWSLTGNVPDPGAVNFDLTFGFNNEYNYIGVPFAGTYTDTQQLANGIGSKWNTASIGAPVQYADGLMFEVFDNSNKNTSKTSMFAWDGGSWVTVNGPSDVFSISSGEVITVHVQPGVYLTTPTTRTVKINSWF